MSKITLSPPKGTRDFGAKEIQERQVIFNTIKRIFEKFGFEPLETPAMETLSVLTEKYGEEGDMLLYKILNSGDFLSKIDEQDLKTQKHKELIKKISQKGLRYDLTIPFARYVAANQHKITFPFKRYQIQPVWRADRPQKGRYREFYQCDADVIGSNSLICETEIIMMICGIFEKLSVKNFSIKINNRKILQGIMEKFHMSEKETLFCTIIDKLDKIGVEKTKEELKNNFGNAFLEEINILFKSYISNTEKVNALKNWLKNVSIAEEGIKEIEKIFSLLQNFLPHTYVNRLEIDIMLARGLAYYTGTIFEAKINNANKANSSVGGGGRYDNLCSIFGLNNVSGVGFSFGIDRIHDAMKQLNLFPNTQFSPSQQILIVNFGEETQKEVLKTAQILRKNEVCCEIYPDADKLKKQFSYANKKGIPFVLVVGPEEVKQKKYMLKNMKTGEQQSVQVEEVTKKI